MFVIVCTYDDTNVDTVKTLVGSRNNLFPDLLIVNWLECESFYGRQMPRKLEVPHQVSQSTYRRTN